MPETKGQKSVHVNGERHSFQTNGNSELNIESNSFVQLHNTASAGRVSFA